MVNAADNNTPRAAQVYTAFRQLDKDGDLRLSEDERKPLSVYQADRLAWKVAEAEGNAWSRLVRNDQVNMIAGSPAVSQAGTSDWFTSVSEVSMVRWMTAKSDVRLSHWFTSEMGEWYGKTVEALLTDPFRDKVARCENRHKRISPPVVGDMSLVETHTPCLWQDKTLTALLSIAEYLHCTGTPETEGRFDFFVFGAKVLAEYHVFNLLALPSAVDWDAVLARHPDMIRYRAADIQRAAAHFARQIRWEEDKGPLDLVIQALSGERDPKTAGAHLMHLIDTLSGVRAIYDLEKIVNRKPVSLGQYADEIDALVTLLRNTPHHRDVDLAVWEQIGTDTVAEFHREFEGVRDRLPLSMRGLMAEMVYFDDVKALRVVADAIDAKTGLTWGMVRQAHRHGMDIQLTAAAVTHLHTIPTAAMRLRWLLRETTQAGLMRPKTPNGHPWHDRIQYRYGHIRLARAIDYLGTYWPTAVAQEKFRHDLPELLGLMSRSEFPTGPEGISVEEFERLYREAKGLGIRRFGQYSPGTLAQVVSDSRHPEGFPRTLYVVSQYDWNGSLRRGVNWDLQALREAGYYVDLMEAGSPWDVLLRMRQLPTHRYRHVVLAAHSNPFDMVIGRHGRSMVDWYDRPFWQSVADRLVQGGMLYLAGCNTGGYGRRSRRDSLVQYVARHHRFAEDVTISGPMCQSGIRFDDSDKGLRAEASCKLNQVKGRSGRKLRHGVHVAEKM